MTLSDAQAWLIILGGLVGLLTTAVVTIINTIRTGRVESKADKTIEIAKTIETNTNSKLTEQDKQIAKLLQEVGTLTAHITKQDETRDNLATLTAQASSPAAATVQASTASAPDEVQTVPAGPAVAGQGAQVVTVPEQVLPVEDDSRPRIVTP